MCDLPPDFDPAKFMVGRIGGSSGADALDGLGRGDLPGISLVMVDGEILVRERSQQTPPPEVLAVIVKEEAPSPPGRGLG